MGRSRNIVFIGGGTPVIPEAAAIYAALGGFWEFEDNAANPTFTDSFGSNDLTSWLNAGTQNTNVSSTGSGLIGRAFGPMSQDMTAFIPRSNTALDLPNSDWTVFGWCKGGAQQIDAASMAFARMGSGGGGSAHVANIIIQNSATQLFGATLWDNTSTAVQVFSSITISTTLWSAFALSLDRTNNLMILRVYKDGVTDKDTAAFNNPLYTAASNANFCFNDWFYNDNTFNSAAQRNLLNGIIDECLFANKSLTDAEFAYLVNGGAGTSYAQLLADSGN
jgi:hypothetical protein